MVGGKTGCGAGWDWKIGLARGMYLRSDRKVKGGNCEEELGILLWAARYVTQWEYRRHMGRKKRQHCTWKGCRAWPCTEGASCSF